MKTTKRFEFKYKITFQDYLTIKPMIESLLIHDQHGEDLSYPVNSLYLDDIYRSGAADKAFGNQFHKKYRIRHYHDESKKKLELKEKVGDESTKHSTMISDAVYQAILSQDLDVLEQHFSDPLIRRFTLDMLRFHLEPMCDIIYQREAFKDESDNLRITFDQSLEVAPFSINNLTEKGSLMHPTTMILEVKYEHYIPKSIKQVLKHVPLQQLSVSKYFLGYTQITP
ncbi:VTC domain-containing protein [Candidatus Xianfuyuplasma coldseepsis]|uniref:VTC domain-containing protein n=1 Tax=Candidatus Xianfuyuplasma coldseepsis TaxID=2782163 RepID=A0A7L7KNY9_9MOLU|nr:VTC domain-containing protein [Xianfuyuplasma coldseepsis]QMS84490.1 VTC domain-containing protein [Xianfuyuplasma coldseepsis]